MRLLFPAASISMAVALSTGCGAPSVGADDVVVVPGQEAVFCASVDNSFMNQAMPGTKVEFYVGRDKLGEGTTDSVGLVSVRKPLPGQSRNWEARALVNGSTVVSRGQVFHWGLDKTVVAVDVDETISRTTYSNLFFTQFDTTSQPVEHSAAALKAMNGDYYICYISARPRWLHNKTKRWLSDHGFPAGPVLHAEKFEACLKQEEYKQRMLAEFQARFPNLLIGIGDKDVDDRAYGANSMLAVILDKSATNYREHCMVFKDWRQIQGFFSTQKPNLCDPVRLAGLIQTNQMRLRPLFDFPADQLARQSVPAPSGPLMPATPASPASPPELRPPPPLLVTAPATPHAKPASPPPAEPAALAVAVASVGGVAATDDLGG